MNPEDQKTHGTTSSWNKDEKKMDKEGGGQLFGGGQLYGVYSSWTSQSKAIVTK